MSSMQRAPSTSSSEENTRKRVCKACDRCRLKKSKCDGSNPCSRCKADNAICVFGERKKAHDKVYPKGYVEMLEQQQSQLVSGLREMYRRMQAGETWPGHALKESHGGFPLTHDILERLSVLQASHDGRADAFEDDLELLQQRCLLTNGGASMRSRAMSEDSEPGLTSSGSSHGMSSPAQSIAFPDSFSHKRTPPTPVMDGEPFQPFNPKSQQQQQFTMQTMGRPAGFNPVPAALLQQAWAAQQLPLEQTMDVDMYAFNPSMSSDAHLFSNPNPFQLQDSMAMGWPDSFDQLINPNALQTS